MEVIGRRKFILIGKKIKYECDIWELFAKNLCIVNFPVWKYNIRQQ